MTDTYKSVRELIYQAIGGIERAPSGVVTDTIWVEGTDPMSVVDALMLAAERLENIEAPKGDELLEAKAMVLDSLLSAKIDGRTAKARLIKYRTGVLVIAKHKGPQ